MAERKSVKSPKSHTKAPVGRKQASLKDLPTVKAGKIVEDYGQQPARSTH